jgi:hypothetical protein
MGPQPDPYRILGLPRGASEAEVKAAYRRLAKAFHPDAAGEKAIPRFLAIQAAYDAITGHEEKPGGSASREPWRADPERARATRPGARGRAGGTREGSPGGATKRPSGQASSGTRTRSRRSRSDSTAGRATPGSTTYDAADREPFNPEWSGASWYGTTSGTYWTINPKEYADPRKHGPEYQARARRAWAGTGATPVGETAAEEAARESPDAEAAMGSAAGSGAAAEPGAPGVHWTAGEREPRYRTGAGPQFRPADRDRGRDAGTGVPPIDASRDRFDLFSSLPLPPGFPTRGAIALLGWPPLGFALATFISEASGCGRFAASCVDTFDFGTWVGQLAIIGLLLAVPRIASISAIGTLAMLAAAGPAAVILSATGGARQREAAAAFLAVVLVAAYLVGVVIAVARAARRMRS